MNNKKKGMEFERALCDILAKEGWWVHYLSPDNRGAQPFDILIAKNGRVYPIDCKTCKDHIFRISRLEDNQIMSFDRWFLIVQTVPWICVEHEGKIYVLSYVRLRDEKKIDLNKEKAVWYIGAD